MSGLSSAWRSTAPTSQCRPAGRGKPPGWSVVGQEGIIGKVDGRAGGQRHHGLGGAAVVAKREEQQVDALPAAAKAAGGHRRKDFPVPPMA